MLLRFHWQIEKLLEELDLGPGFCLISPHRLVLIKYIQTGNTKVDKI